ncbi:MAG: PQQ-binding-like beta-propeller repeat protein [Chloroflexota bacterium]
MSRVEWPLNSGGPTLRLTIVLLPLLVTLFPAVALAHGPGSWPVSGHDAQASYYNGSEHQLGPNNAARLHVVWHFPGGQASQIIATGSTVYALVPHDGTYAVEEINARTGALIRLLPPRALHLSSGEIPAALAYVHGTLVVAGNLRTIVGINAKAGRFRWSAHASASSLVTSGSVIYTGKRCSLPPQRCGILASYAIDARTGHILWKHPGNGTSAPVAFHGLLYQDASVAPVGTRVYRPDNGSQAASLPLRGEWAASSARLFFGAYRTAGRPAAWVASIDATGKPAWKVKLGNVPGSAAPPVAGPDMLYVPSYRFHPGVVALKESNGRSRWAADTGMPREMMGANGLLMALRASDGALLILNVKTGRSIKTISAAQGAGGHVMHAIVAAGTVYESSDRGIAALRA